MPLLGAQAVTCLAYRRRGLVEACCYKSYKRVERDVIAHMMPAHFLEHSCGTLPVFGAVFQVCIISYDS